MRFFSFLEKCLEESPTLPSSIRLQMLIATFAVVVLPMIVWAVSCFYEKKLVEIPVTVSTFCTSVFAASLAAKVIQYNKE